jgi:small conductance mechanosensitive channel
VPIKGVLSTLSVASVELTLLLIFAMLVYAVIGRVLEAAAGRVGQVANSSRALKVRARNVLIVTCVLLTVIILAYNGWLVAHGIDGWSHTATWLSAVSRDLWIGAAIALGKLTAAALAVVVVTRVVRRGLGRIERAVIAWKELSDHAERVSVAIIGLTHAIVTAVWLLLAVFACRLFAVPAAIADGLVTIVRAYLVVAIGLLLIRSSAVIVDILDACGRRYVKKRDWQTHYDHLRPLIPTLRACLEYALWVAVATLALLQFGWIGQVAVWGPRLIQAIGLLFLGRVLVELGHLEISRRMLPREGLDEMARRRRETMTPVIRSTYAYAVYFGTAVLIVATLGFNPMPFLAGAGILGLVVGFGAQSLIHDVVSGFFILFENTFLVGDAVEAAGAKGVVEAIEFRTTKIRDADGRLHIIRNGDVKQVVNYSKEYALAVVAVDVAYDADLPQVFAILREASERTRSEGSDLLGETRIDGITAFGPTSMTVRTATRVKPGRHEPAAAALRLAIKTAFDRRAVGAPRNALVPARLSGSIADVAASRR